MMLAEMPQPAMVNFFVAELLYSSDGGVVSSILVMSAQLVSRAGVQGRGDQKL